MHSFFNAISSRFAVFLLGILVAILGLVSPGRVLDALRTTLIKDSVDKMFCKNC